MKNQSLAICLDKLLHKLKIKNPLYFIAEGYVCRVQLWYTFLNGEIAFRIS